jgi:transcriptional regulator with XRE-family HTH domain
VEPSGIGKKIKFYRQQRGVTQMELADRIGVSYQQIQKYEKERSQITLHRLFLIAKALDTPVQSFLTEQRASHFSEKSGKHLPGEPPFPVLSREDRSLLRLFARIKNPQVKRMIIRLVESIVAQQSGE